VKLAFILDPLEGLKAYKDSVRGHDALRGEARPRDLGHPARGADLARRAASPRARSAAPSAPTITWYSLAGEAVLPLTAYDAVLMRQDPPFDFEYVAATWLLERAEAEGARIWNKPRSIRDHSEKVAIAEFPQFTPTTLIARDPADIHAFIDELGDVILKPLDGMGGSSIFRVTRDDPNRNVIVETLTGSARAASWRSATCRPSATATSASC
jgi:glutathione synthase